MSVESEILGPHTHTLAWGTGWAGPGAKAQPSHVNSTWALIYIFSNIRHYFDQTITVSVAIFSEWDVKLEDKELNP